MTIKIEKKILVKFLDRIHMSGTQAIEELVLDFDKDGLKVNADSPPQLAKVMGWLKKESFKEYEEIKKIGINQLDIFIKVLNRFDNILFLEHSGNVLTIKGKNKTVDIELVDVNFIEASKASPTLEFKDSFALPPKKLQSIFNDVQLNKDAVIEIETVEKKVNIKNSGKYKFNNIVEAPMCKGGVKVSFGQPLIEAATKLDGDLEINVNNDYPIKILEKSKEMTITIIAAPYVKGDSDETSEETTEDETKEEESKEE